MARYVMRARRILLHHVLHADDTPHKIALGAALATFVTFLPIPGIQTVISVALAALMRANKAICIPIVWITNPLTFVPIYGGCYVLGRSVLSASVATEAEIAEISDRVSRQMGGSAGLGRFVEWSYWEGMFQTLFEFGADLWVGCAIVSVALGVAAYFLTRWGVNTYREKHRQRILRRSLFRAKLNRNTAQGGEPS